MDKELIPGMTSFPSNLTYIKEKKDQTFQIDRSTVNFNINLQSAQYVMGSAEQMIAIQSFSHEYYQLLVTCEDDVFTNNVITIIASRALNQYLVPAEILERCSALTEEGIKELKTFPAIICQENTGLNGVTDSNQWAVYAYIKRVQICGKEIKVAFQPIAAIQQQLLCTPKNSVFFDLNIDCAITDLNYSAWSVHKINLFEAFRESGICNVPIPNEAIK